MSAEICRYARQHALRLTLAQTWLIIRLTILPTCARGTGPRCPTYQADDLFMNEVVTADAELRGCLPRSQFTISTADAYTAS